MPLGQATAITVGQVQLTARQPAVLIDRAWKRARYQWYDIAGIMFVCHTR
jgi:hypothetical protein